MFGLYNVSGRSRTSGSDTDLQLWLPGWAFQAATFVFKVLGLSEYCFATYHFGGERVELFILDANRPERKALAALHNSKTQQAWDEATFTAYTAEKGTIAHLRGLARKAAKAQLAVKYGLDPIVYLQSLSAQEAQAYGLSSMWAAALA
jgi:hypothetical protein